MSWIPHFVSGTWNSDFQSLEGSWIDLVVFLIPKPTIPDSTSKDFADFRFQNEHFSDWEIRVTLHVQLITLLWFLLLTDWISYDGKRKSNMESIQNSHPRRCKKKPFVTIYNGLMSVCQFFLSYFRKGVIKKMMMMMMILIKLKLIWHDSIRL